VTIDIQTTTDLIIGLVQEVYDNDNLEIEVSENMPLIGGESALDSMKFVELCLALEDKALDSGFEFDWTSETAMSKSRSMFRSIKTLAEEYVNQFNAP
jgi:acyl carrier protein